MDFYHVLNRGVDKRTTFQDDADYLRFIQNLYIFNSTENAPHNTWSTSARMQMKQNDRLVIIHAFCLMPNHYHLLISPIYEDGVALFMKKVGMGYSKYFNERNDRVGALWQGKYKGILLNNDAYFNYIPHYIHLNALDLSMPEWREGKIKNFQKALNNLNIYKWSSHRFFLKPHLIDNSIIKNTFLKKRFHQQSKYIKEIKSIVSDKSTATHSKIIE